MREVVPKINKTVKEKLAQHPDPVKVPVHPKPGCKTNDCWKNVPKLIDQYGGKLVTGRIVWIESSGKWLHLEAHCNWELPDGSVIDPTPKEDGEREIVFVEEPLSFEGKMIPSKYICCSSEPQMQRYVSSLQRNSEILSALSGGELLESPNALFQMGIEQMRLGSLVDRPQKSSKKHRKRKKRSRK